ncbi:hypothetical protein [Pseudonocardia humida]|uniref:Subtilisin inhibitor-like n=1 Tax=Pseudonocardia humida TaxID=2800819 RepID=A0ABT1A0F7_9PSEU|nr:hypothetical protein [Pseudonocardia humida]MCO1656491.1 hypothetical protein [Pseudonocardia humida]
MTRIPRVGDRRAGTAAALLTLLLSLLVLAGCAATGGDGVASAGAPATGAADADAGPEPSADNDERGRQFAQCMRDNGVDMADPVDGRIEVRGRRGDEATLEAAQEACEQYAPGGGEKPDAAASEQLRAFAQCMRDNGLPGFPDPQPDGGLMITRDSGIDMDSEEFKAAEAACDDLRPEPPGGRSAGGGS